MPARFSSFRVATTVPITRASCMSGRDVDCVDDADDSGVDGAIFQARRHARRTATDDEHGLTNACVNRVDGHEVTTFGFALGVDRTYDQQLAAD